MHEVGGKTQRKQIIHDPSALHQIYESSTQQIVGASQSLDTAK